MKTRFISTRGILTAIITLAACASAFADEITFYPVGQLPGGSPNSQIRDAVLTNQGILAAGYATQNPNSQDSAGSGDTAVMWTPHGGLKMLATLPAGTATPAQTKNVTASAIASFSNDIASRSLTDSTGQNVEATLVSNGGKSLTKIGQLPGLAPYSAAVALSADGRVVYGFNKDSLGNQIGFRWTHSEGVTLLGLPPGSAGSGPAGRATSADGSIAVGGETYGPGGVGFVYRHGKGISALPLAAGGTWTGAFAITPGGHFIVGSGDSTAFPSGEFLVWHDGKVLSLGLPSAETSTNNTNFGGVTAGGRVVVTFDNNSSYFHNRHGWFNLQAVLEVAGVDLTDWSSLLAFGVSSDGRLVFGSGINSTGYEGFVVKLPHGYLLNYGKPSHAADEDNDDCDTN
jgi:hypothetical protein